MTKAQGSFISRYGAYAAMAWSKLKVFSGLLFKVKFLVTSLSAIVSIVAYWWTLHLGLAGATLFVALIFIHEMGHVLVNRRFGIPSSAPVFIPFVGALITMKKYPLNVEQEAWSGLGGPVLGSIGALGCLPIYLVTHNPLWMWGATVGILINLFNLIPISPLDGGRAIGAVSRWFWFVGLALIAAYGAWTQSFLMLMILFLGMDEIDRRLVRLPRSVWVALAAFYAVIMLVSHDWWLLALVLYSVLTWYLYPKREAVAAHDEDDTADHDGNEDGDEADAENENENGDKIETVEALVTKDSYFEVSPTKRVMFGVIYLGLVGVLGTLLYWLSAQHPV